jgi:xanthine/CO dehydrogenase XdhC/CoxF family maturation factor
VVITSDKEASAISFPNVVIATDPEMAVSEALRRLRNTGVPESAVIGIDPGNEPGIAVVANGIVEAVYRVPLRQASKIVERIRQTYPDILVRIGNGARLTSTHLANALISHGIAVEFVDERNLAIPGEGHGRNRDFRHCCRNQYRIHARHSGWTSRRAPFEG